MLYMIIDNDENRPLSKLNTQYSKVHIPRFITSPTIPSCHSKLVLVYLQIGQGPIKHG